MRLPSQVTSVCTCGDGTTIPWTIPRARRATAWAWAWLTSACCCPQPCLTCLTWTLCTSAAAAPSSRPCPPTAGCTCGARAVSSPATSPRAWRRWRACGCAPWRRAQTTSPRWGRAASCGAGAAAWRVCWATRHQALRPRPRPSSRPPPGALQTCGRQPWWAASWPTPWCCSRVVASATASPWSRGTRGSPCLRGTSGRS
mmetsp:Transcript_11716/g.29614  ORF Transcript_11716/g.29614 Transcript_11716/m.29614 type:complete len:200 (-) Transcript_11716:576-1175(-)